jgi:tryptophan synthase beta chain
MRQTKIVLSDKEIPTKWYNIMADMPNKPKPPLTEPDSHWTR